MSLKFDVEEKKAANLYSSHDILKSMTEFLEEGLPQVGYQLVMRWSNLRLGVMFLACCAALYGQFGAAFPKETLKIAACVVVYFALSGIVTAMDYFILKDSNLVIKDNSVGDVFVGLTMRKGESHVTMSMRGKPGKEEFRVDIGKLFDTDGVLLQTPMMDLFVRNFNSFIKSDKKKN